VTLYKNKKPLFKKKDKIEYTYKPILFLKEATPLNYEIAKKRINTYPYWLSPQELFGKGTLYFSRETEAREVTKLALWVPEFVAKVMGHEIFFPHVLGDNGLKNLPLHFYGLALEEFKVAIKDAQNITVEKRAVKLLVGLEIFICLRKDLVRAL
jgi:hypothetical protein